ncbi:hypothetical protein SKP52_02565 [Sphingopyxis fribergensis]|uniref:Uncharacterized protein n=1 Tax=Sphingopyxis fribergensis TaxID=1515612 RepID=A0A0A7PDY7_9SPHN|nr:hypothetical protein SKP52_02565 [Sphingopyxis fribergensis]
MISSKPRARVKQGASGAVAHFIRDDGWNQLVRWSDFPSLVAAWAFVQDFAAGGHPEYPILNPRDFS